MEDNLETQFHKLAKTWKEETAYLSSVTTMANHPAYQEIIKMGWPVVPLILQELQRKPDHWFWALAGHWRKPGARRRCRSYQKDDRGLACLGEKKRVN
jgi:hypothetical protein